MFTSIAAATFAVPHIDNAIAAYRDILGYELKVSSLISVHQAEAWRLPALAGAKAAIMAPSSGARVFLRMIEQAGVESPEPHRTLGWNGTEILVADPDQLANSLEGTPFRILGPPADLAITDKIRMLPVCGPAGEFLLLTSVRDGFFGVESARSTVDRAFLVACGVHDLSAMLAFWRDILNCPAGNPIEVNMPALNKTYGFEPERKHAISLIKLTEAFYVEFNTYPPGAQIRYTEPGHLPGGLGMVSFVVPDFSAITKGNIFVSAEVPYSGRRAALLRSPEGALIELIEGV